MVKFSDETSYGNYLFLRRQLGQQENADISVDKWSGTWPFNQQVAIDNMLRMCADMQKDRDLSWNNYLHSKNGEKHTRTYQTEKEWNNAPLFIKASIIKPHGAWTGECIYDELSDKPDSEVVAW